jgi:hypothetical protein
MMTPIKMVINYAMEEKVKQSVISEIEGQIIKPDADSQVDMIMLDQEQTYIDSIMKVDTFRGAIQQQQDDEDNYVWREDSEANSER